MKHNHKPSGEKTLFSESVDFLRLDPLPLVRLDGVTDDDFVGVSPLADVTDDEDLSLCDAILRPISESLALQEIAHQKA